MYGTHQSNTNGVQMNSHGLLLPGVLRNQVMSLMDINWGWKDDHIDKTKTDSEAIVHLTFSALASVDGIFPVILSLFLS